MNTYTLNGSLGSDVRVILNVTFDLFEKNKKNMNKLVDELKMNAPHSVASR